MLKKLLPADAYKLATKVVAMLLQFKAFKEYNHSLAERFLSCKKACSVATKQASAYNKRSDLSQV